MSKIAWKKPTSITLGRKDRRTLQKLADEAKCSRSEFVRRLIRAQVVENQQGGES